MKTFSDLLATDLKLNVVVNGNQQSVDLHSLLTFNANDLVEIDDVEILPRYQYLAIDNRLHIHEPFYQWYHKVSGQGWLLEPQLSSKNVER